MVSVLVDGLRVLECSQLFSKVSDDLGLVDKFYLLVFNGFQLDLGISLDLLQILVVLDLLFLEVELGKLLLEFPGKIFSNI